MTDIIEWKGSSALYMPAEDERIMRYEWKLYIVKLRVFNMVRARFCLPPIEVSHDIEPMADMLNVMATFKRAYPVFFNELVEEHHARNNSER